MLDRRGFGGVLPRPSRWVEPSGASETVVSGPKTEASEVDLCALPLSAELEKRRLNARPTEEDRFEASRTMGVSSCWACGVTFVIAIVRKYG